MCLTYWKDFLLRGSLDDYDSVVYRHLNCPRNHELLDKLNRFVTVPCAINGINRLGGGGETVQLQFDDLFEEVFEC